MQPFVCHAILWFPLDPSVGTSLPPVITWALLVILTRPYLPLPLPLLWPCLTWPPSLTIFAWKNFCPDGHTYATYCHMPNQGRSWSTSLGVPLPSASGNLCLPGHPPFDPCQWYNTALEELQCWLSCGRILCLWTALRRTVLHYFSTSALQYFSTSVHQYYGIRILQYYDVALVTKH